MLEVRTSGAPPPTLLSLCLDAVAANLARDSAGRSGWPDGSGSDGLDGAAEDRTWEEEDGHLSPEEVAEALPWELLHRLASQLPPVALESLHHAAQARYPPSRVTLSSNLIGAHTTIEILLFG
jgi:hypothetical protein